jgi:hypothetical protein
VLRTLRILCLLLAALAAADAVLVIASLFIADRAPLTSQATTVSLVVAALFTMMAGLALALQHSLTRLGRAISSSADEEPAGRAFRQLVVTLLFTCLIFGPLLALVSYAILARIEEGFAVFG